MKEQNIGRWRISNTKAGCIINKFDLNMDVTRRIRVFLDEENIFHISSLPYDEKDEFLSVDNRAIGNEAHGAGPLTAQKLFDLKPDILITGNGPGGNAATVLQRANITIYTGAGDVTVKEAYDAYKNNGLTRLLYD